MSVKVPRPGTRGASFPRLIPKLFGGLARPVFRRRGGARTQGGVPALILETVGAKSGLPRHAILGYVEEDPQTWLVVASLAGASRNPGWLFNLARNPVATVEFGDGRRVSVEATTLDGPGLEAAWERIAVDAPEYVRYRSKTDRPIPVLRLRAAADQSGADARG
jgi:deazaflavin-dependent oxidoreductase (nitroreductase family)